MSTNWVYQGRCWKFGDNISTDLIQPADVTWGHVRGPERLKYCMRANRPGWAEQVGQGDILIAGTNFGCGSSRPAARMLRDLGITTVIAESISRLFMRNSVNIGFPALICPGITGLVEEGDEVYVNVDTGEVKNLLRELRPIEADILRQRFGLETEQELTLKEIGEKYNLSRERIRQLQEQALGKIRRQIRE